MSRLTTRPPGPDPVTSLRSTPASLAIRLASGEAFTRLASPAGTVVVAGVGAATATALPASRIPPPDAAAADRGAGAGPAPPPRRAAAPRGGAAGGAPPPPRRGGPAPPPTTLPTGPVCPSATATCRS